MSVMLLVSFTSLILTDTDRDLNSNTKSTPLSGMNEPQGHLDITRCEISLVPRKLRSCYQWDAGFCQAPRLGAAVHGVAESLTRQSNWTEWQGEDLPGLGTVVTPIRLEKEESRTNNFREMFSNASLWKEGSRTLLIYRTPDYLKEHYAFSSKMLFILKRKHSQEYWLKKVEHPGLLPPKSQISSILSQIPEVLFSVKYCMWFARKVLKDSLYESTL